MSPAPLQATGLAFLLVYGAKLMPPRNGRPGIRVTVDSIGTLVLEAVGYPCATTAEEALERAGHVCLDADLIVEEAPADVRRSHPALQVRRR